MQTVLITGATKGIGKALAQKFLREGYRVFATSMEALDYAHEDLKVFPLDLRSPESIAACASEIEQTRMPVDILINNAGVLLDEDETMLVPERLRATLEVNLIGTAAFTEAILPFVSAQGSIVMISSTAGSLALVDHPSSHYPRHYPAYKISKAALNMYMRTLALRLGDTGITVFSVHPGWVRTDMGGEEADLAPEEAAEGLYETIISRPQTGGFYFKKERLPW
jgi:Dehydrogenases with different specificities (related to short-chain alcohol dehydrogenases)